MATLRSGIFGTYYGSTKGTSESLTTSEMRMNADYIYSSLKSSGWSINSIAAILGNIQAESTINPGRWEGDAVYEGAGFGLVQWTPHSKYIDWCSSEGIDDYTEMDANLLRILYEVDNKIQWIPTSTYNFSFELFTISDLPVSELSKAFLLNYERPKDQSVSVQNYRASLSEAWYEYLTGTQPDDPVIKPKKKKGYKFILFKKTRRIYG